MFYSHEILTSRQFGVATVWLVATAPGVTTRRVAKKAILEVDVPKACGTIVSPPGAPIALRLQANLLYGVTRVYSQQCGYILTDCEKIQSNMERFYRVLGASNLDMDISAGKNKRQQLILLDDPDFVLNFQLPAFDLDFTGPTGISQNTNKTSSQFSPAESGRSLSSGGDSFAGALQIRRSSTIDSPGLDPVFGDANMSGVKHDNHMIFDDEDLPMGGIGLAIDADGNIIEEPDLPDYNQQPVFGGNDDALGVQLHQQQQMIDDEPLLFDDEELPIVPADEVLPDAQAAQVPQGDEIFDLEEQEVEEQVAVPAKKAKKAKVVHVIPSDTQTMVALNQIKAWNTDYVENMEQAVKPHRTTPTEAKENGWNMTFGWGIGLIGAPTLIPGLAHPLAEFYSGNALKAALLGHSDDEQEFEAQRGRRRTSSEMLEDEEDELSERRVRARNDDGEIGLAMDNDQLMFDDEPGVEVGREAQPELSEMPSLPWNRQSSLIPSSAAKARPGIPGSGRGFESSPMVGRGSNLRDIERYSDNVASSDAGGFAPLLDQHHGSSDNFNSGFAAGEGSRGDTQISQAMRAALDSDGRNFLAFVEGIAAKKGVLKDDEDEDDEYRWIDFSDLFEGEDETRVVAAQAFYQVLSLVTKKALRVEQEGEDKVPHDIDRNIRIGVRVEALDLDEADSDEAGKGKAKATTANKDSDEAGDDADDEAGDGNNDSSGQDDNFEDAEEFLE